jgi:hypothetical protein
MPQNQAIVRHFEQKVFERGAQFGVVERKR